MDLDRLDALSRSLASGGSRRLLLGALTTAPVLGRLFTLLNPDDAVAKERRRRRKRRHKRRKNPGLRKGKGKPGCRPNGKAAVCTGTCGEVKSRETCGKTVDCGSCDCPVPCGDCEICQSGPNAPGQCVPDPDRAGEACGSDGQTCHPGGTCECDAGSCANPTPICDTAGICVGCDDDSECVAAGAGNLCCAGSCFTGICCADSGCLTGEAPDCVGYDCVCASNSNSACPTSQTCCNDGCMDLDTDPDNCGACGDPCSGTTPICAEGICVACSTLNPCPTGQCCAGDGSCGACLVFVTSTVSNGNLGGLSGAHQRCQTLATAAGLPGTYLAWLSDEGVAAPIDFFTRATVPYRLTNGTTIAANWNDLTDGTLAAPIDRDEMGNAVSPSRVWTNTHAQGNVSGRIDCENWLGTNLTTRVGATNQTDVAWSRILNHEEPCTSADVRLYCFQQS